jgi:secreted PhoX family phosphatase
MSRPLSRRDFLASGLASLTAVVVGPGLLPRIVGAPRVSDGPYGLLRPPDANGVMLPRGFTSRVVARSGTRVAGTSYVWHDNPDGGATFPTKDDGFIYVSNSESNAPDGGVGAIRFDADARIVDAYRICDGTARNCAGGPTPWGTWLTCEEIDRGRVWECDPTGKEMAVVLPALGVFQHESAAVDPVNERVYLTEDQPDGRFYRFSATRYPSLKTGVLEVADVATDGRTTWRPVPDPSARSVPTRKQVAQSTRFDGGEGTWYDAGIVYFTTKGDNRVWAYDTRDDSMSVLYDASTVARAPLTGVDNITGSASGDLYVAEDGGNLEIVMITPDEQVAVVMRLTGSAHGGSEIAGPAFDPSGRRLYFSSQRGERRGITFEVTGPFRKPAAEATPRPRRTRDPLASPLPVSASGDDGLPIGVTAGAAAAAAAAAAVGGRALSRRRRRGADRPDA